MARRQKVCINVSETLPHQPMLLDKPEDLVVPCRPNKREGMQQRKNVRPVLEVAAGKLSNDEWVTEDLTLLQRLFEPHIPSSQVVDPDRGIDKDHVTCPRNVCGEPA